METTTERDSLRYTKIPLTNGSGLIPALGLNGMIQFDGIVTDMPAWYSDKGVLLSTSMYESFGMNIGEAMAVGAFPVIHDFPGADLLWPA